MSDPIILSSRFIMWAKGYTWFVEARNPRTHNLCYPRGKTCLPVEQPRFPILARSTRRAGVFSIAAKLLSSGAGATTKWRPFG